MQLFLSCSLYSVPDYLILLEKTTRIKNTIYGLNIIVKKIQQITFNEKYISFIFKNIMNNKKKIFKRKFVIM